MAMSYGSPFAGGIVGTATSAVSFGFYTEPGGTPTWAASKAVTAPATVVANIKAAPATNVVKTFFYYLVPGEGATNNSLFNVTQKSGPTEAKIDFKIASTAGTKSLRIAAEDENGRVTEKILTVVVS